MTVVSTSSPPRRRRLSVSASLALLLLLAAATTASALSATLAPRGVGAGLSAFVSPRRTAVGPASSSGEGRRRSRPLRPTAIPSRPSSASSSSSSSAAAAARPASRLRASIGTDGGGEASSSTASSTSSSATTADATAPVQTKKYPHQTFDLTTALFCGGLAFDAYAEPPANSTRWERGSRGLNVAFLSPAFTRSLYRGLVQVTPLRCTDLPDEDSAAEKLMTGSGVDAYLTVGVVEGKWKEDVKLIEGQYHEGVRDLQGCAHVGRSNTAWSNVNQKAAEGNLKEGKSGAYHVKSSWGKGGQAVWEDDPPFYLYVQDPAAARLVFTVVDDDVVGDGDVVGSAYRRLSDLIPIASRDDAVSAMKEAVLAKLRSGGDPSQATQDVEGLTGRQIVESMVQDWEGDIKLQSKPRIKDKGGQTVKAAAVGAMVAGPVGAAVGGVFGQLYEGEVRGRVSCRIRYLPIPEADVVKEKYRVKGGLPGVDWGQLYENRIDVIRKDLPPDSPDPHLGDGDLEFCFFVNHDVTGCSCAVYRSLNKRLIAVSFRGTCVPKDIITDASIVQAAWVDGEDVSRQDIPKVHRGFRSSLNSISRRLKELILAAVAPGESLSDYDVVVTGHSLGGALATLFTADVAEFGMDAGRALPQLEPSEPWWNGLASGFFGGKDVPVQQREPPRPKSLRMYNFGSPRVGNDEFVARFDSLMEEGRIDEAYRIVNGEDLVTRMPRTMNALVLGQIGYNHCGPTVLIEPPKIEEGDDKKSLQPSVLWIEGESSDDACPVRDGAAITSPLASGALLGDIVSGIQSVTADIATDEGRDKVGGAPFDISKASEYASKFGEIADTVSGRLKQLTVDDLPSLVGIDKKYTAREIKIIQSLLSGSALSHHMEDEYYKGMGMACGYLALVGQDLRPLESLEGGVLPEDDIVELERSTVVDEAKDGAMARNEDDTDLDLEVWNSVVRVLKEEKSAEKE